MYLTGDVWGYVIEGALLGQLEESCWGFFGYDYCVEQAQEAAEHIRKRLNEIEDHLATCSYDI